MVNVVARHKERAFPRYKIPLRGMIDGRAVSIADWSVAGLGLADVTFDLAPGSPVVVNISVTANGHMVEFPLNAEVVWTDPASRRAGVRLLDGAEGIAPLVELSDAFLAGRLTVGPTGLTILDRKMTEKGIRDMAVVDAGAPVRTGQNLAGRIIGLITFAVVGAAAFLFLANIVYERLFTFDALSANIAADTISVVIPVDGTVHFVDLPQGASSGAKIAEVKGATQADIVSPCDCHVLMHSQQDGTFARAGQAIMTLVRKDAQPHVAVRVPFRRLAAISDGARISLTYLDGTTVNDAKLLSIPKITEETAAQLIVNVDAGRKLDASLAGQPVYAKFDTAPWN